MAVNDKDPTEAILLVEQTIGTFNQIVVGQEGQMVPVPGHPDQPTLAERVKQNLKPSTDAAAGFAAQASASAKAADDAVKLASQISGLETVADAIGMAALPLPDVWAPLSDSLRLITGYGRDVLVGSDVVARMVNFSRNSTATYIGKDGQLKTAAANEPRFEREGLLIEGQSTNIVPRSTDMSLSPWYTGFGGTGKVPVITSNYGIAPDGSQSASRVVLDKGAGTDPSNDSTVMCTLSTVAGTTYTLSVWMKSTDGAATQKVSLSLNGTMATTVTVTGEWRRYSVTALATDSSRIPRLQLRGGAGTSDTADLLAWGWQQEALPFASSYIPTTGSAVTRAADICWLNVASNHFANGTYAFYASCKTAV
ncbi:phage head spike fiber domain-containing protein [Aeromonas hydrophila]|uniref:phage head spike fiber domain-containing protein n=1 Tax=Aeromonas hydrophila TaxID=644 RepID=UPI003EC927A1